VLLLMANPRQCTCSKVDVQHVTESIHIRTERDKVKCLAYHRHCNTNCCNCTAAKPRGQGTVSGHIITGYKPILNLSESTRKWWQLQNQLPPDQITANRAIVSPATAPRHLVASTMYETVAVYACSVPESSRFYALAGV
jgi:hypothetical protein